MKIILTQDVERLGKKGEVVVVRDGYARNYLLPKGLAIYATKARLNQIEAIRAELLKREERQLKKLKNLAQQLETLSLKIELKMGESGAFGAITNADIARLLKENGFEVDRHKIELSTPIKEPGIYDIPVNLGAVSATIKLWVTPVQV